MPNLSLDFCAGFFDADGCVSISKSNNQVTLYWYNDFKEVLELIAESLGVPNTPRPREKPKGGTSYYLAVGRREIVLPLIEKFLEIGCVVKRKKLLEAREIASQPLKSLETAWTEDEDNVLKNNTDKTCTQVAWILGKRLPAAVARTSMAIRARRHKLGLKSTRPKVRCW